MTDALKDKARRLEEILEALDHGVVLFSGGTDSSLVAYLARRVIGQKALALTVLSPLSPPEEVEAARSFAARVGLEQVELELDELSLPGFAANGPDRCYLCRKARQELVRTWARSRGMTVLLDGMNVSDLDDYRPGLRAADEDGVSHPLIAAGLAKADVRELSFRLGLSSWDRPSQPCLASRFPHGFSLTPERVARVATAEAFLASAGLGPLRVRHFPCRTAVIAAEDPGRLLANREAVVGALREAGFAFVTVDMEGLLSGSLNRLLKDERRRES